MGQVDRLRARADLELAEDVGDMGAGGVTGDEELIGDRLVGAAGNKQAQNVPFALTNDN
jgi:hypothetical protein